MVYGIDFSSTEAAKEYFAPLDKALHVANDVINVRPYAGASAQQYCRPFLIHLAQWTTSLFVRYRLSLNLLDCDNDPSSEISPYMVPGSSIQAECSEMEADC